MKQPTRIVNKSPRPRITLWTAAQGTIRIVYGDRSLVVDNRYEAVRLAHTIISSLQGIED